MLADKTTTYGENPPSDERPGLRPGTGTEVGLFPDRVKEIVGSEKMRAFARRAGVDDKSLRAYMSGESEPSRPALLALAAAGGVNVLWLATGNGPKLLGASDELRVDEPHAGYVYLPLYDVRASAGSGRIVDSEPVVDVLAFKEEWIRQELHVRPGDLNLIYVEGDSMEPDLRAGDIVLVDHTDTRASREGVYVIRMDDALLVKKLQRLPGGVIKVISRNEAYEPFTIAMSEVGKDGGVRIIGRVVWACRRL